MFLWQIPPVENKNANKVYQEIRNWVAWLSANNCFCPDDSTRPFCKYGNIKCYISSPGQPDGSISDDKSIKRVLRMGPSDRGSRCLHTAVADLLTNSFGSPLKKYCHFGPEVSILKNLLRTISNMEVDLRALFASSPIYDTKKHITKLHMQSEVPGLATSDHNKPGKYLCDFEWKEPGNGIKSQGVGVNMWALLSLVSLLGNKDIHCKARGRASQAILKLILKMSPAACTPGGMFPVRSFHERSVEPELVCVSMENRCDHFLRPIDDDNFAFNGVFSYCGLVNGKMPEDLLGCAGVQAMADFFQCDYVEVPPSEVYCQYNLQWKRYHHVYRLEDDTHGNIIIEENHVVFNMDGEEGCTWDIDNWEQELKRNKFLVLPMIWRSGALILLPDQNTVGCLVPDKTCNKLSNYDHELMCYHALVDENEYVKVPVLDVLKTLITPGTILWIRSETQLWEDLRQLLPPPPGGLTEEEADSRWIKARLNVPIVVDPRPGDVYLTVLQRSKHSVHVRDMTYRHIVASPWELSAQPPMDERLWINELSV